MTSGLIRSSECVMLNIIFKESLAAKTIETIGRLNIVQFIDNNIGGVNDRYKSKQKIYTKLRKKILELRSLIEEVEIESVEDNKEIFEIEQEVGEWTRRVLQTKTHLNGLKRELIENREYLIVCEQSLLLLNPPEYSETDTVSEKSEIELEDIYIEDKVELHPITGTINKEIKGLYERLIFRATLGNSFVRFRDIPQSDNCVFVCYYQGDIIKDRCLRVASSLGAHIYSIPSTIERIENSIEQTELHILEIENVILNTNLFLKNISLNIHRHINSWIREVNKLHNIVLIMNLCSYNIAARMLTAKAWCVRNEVKKLIHFTKSIEGVIISHAEPVGIPPTHLRTNSLIKPFQEITNTFFIPQYRLINPAPFMFITFPFLFGVMFGDLGHGLIIFLIGLCLVKLYKKFPNPRNELLRLLFNGRYLIVMFGICSLYVGSLYNEAFSIPLGIFKTCWTKSETNDYKEIFDIGIKGCVYSWGVDPKWAFSVDSLKYYNSLKMKMSVLFGFLHNFLGHLLGLTNSIYKKDILTIIFDIIPQIILFTCSTGYLSFLIIYKWVTNWNLREGETGGISILSTMIKMGVKIGDVEGPQFFNNQESIQKTLIIIIIIMIVIMWVPKPFFIRRKQKKIQNLWEMGIIETNYEPTVSSLSHLFLEQSTQTLEYVLGLLSNTASYLRLWAVSLAHSELSLIFYEFLILIPLKVPMLIFFGFALWALITVLFLIVLESLSSFLHTLRLHWVEFFSKFMNVEEEPGILFIPFNLD